MSLATQQLSLPAPVLLFLEWLKKTEGRDKLYRLWAYGSKVPIYLLKTNNGDKELISRLSKGASTVGQGRKFMRLFKSLDYFQEFLKSFSIKDEFERYTNLLKQFMFAVWMVCDHIQWFNKAGYLKLQHTKKLDEIHSKAWFYGLFFSVLLAGYKLKQVLDSIENYRNQLRVAESNNNKEGINNATKQLKDLEQKQFKQAQGVVKSGIDIIIPAARLGWVPVNDGIVGLAGTITSFIGIYDTFPSSKPKSA